MQEPDRAPRFQRVVVEPNLDPSGLLRRALAHLSKHAPIVQRERKERHTRHLWLELDAGGAPLALFVKRYLPPLTRNLLTALLRSRAEREYDNSRSAHALGLPVLPAVAFGERRILGTVVDQFVAFHTVAPLRSLSSLLRRSKRPDHTRNKHLPIFAEALGQLHQAGYLHGAASPRNLLRIGARGARRFVWIDHPSAVLAGGDVRGREPALYDVLQAFESSLLFPDEGARARFLERYAPGDGAFAARALAAWRHGVRAGSLRRRLAFRSVFSRRSAAARAPSDPSADAPSTGS